MPKAISLPILARQTHLLNRGGWCFCVCISKCNVYVVKLINVFFICSFFLYMQCIAKRIVLVVKLVNMYCGFAWGSALVVVCYVLSTTIQKRFNHTYYCRSPKLTCQTFWRLPAAIQRPFKLWECLRQVDIALLLLFPWGGWVSAVPHTLYLITFPLISILYNSNGCHVSFFSVSSTK